MDSTTEGPGNTTDVNIVIKSWKDLYLVVLYYVPVAIAIDRFATPVWCAIGLLGNLISVRIWVLRRMRKCNRYVLLISSTFKKTGVCFDGVRECLYAYLFASVDFVCMLTLNVHLNSIHTAHQHFKISLTVSF